MCSFCREIPTFGVRSMVGVDEIDLIFFFMTNFPFEFPSISHFFSLRRKAKEIFQFHPLLRSISLPQQHCVLFFFPLHPQFSTFFNIDTTNSDVGRRTTTWRKSRMISGEETKENGKLCYWFSQRDFFFFPSHDISRAFTNTHALDDGSIFIFLSRLRIFLLVQCKTLPRARAIWWLRAAIVNPSGVRRSKTKSNQMISCWCSRLMEEKLSCSVVCRFVSN